MISVNILSDQKPGREFVRAISMFSVFTKAEMWINQDRAQINVFGGFQTPGKANHFQPGDIDRPENMEHAVSFIVNNYKSDDLAVLMENDVIPCNRFLWYIKKMEKSCPHKESLRVGYSPLPRLVKWFRQSIKDRRSQWVDLLSKNWFGSQFMFMRVRQWGQFLSFLRAYKPDGLFQLDRVVRDWLTDSGRERISVLVPNAAFHIGRVSAVYQGGSLRGQGEENSFPKQSFCYLEDPFAMGEDQWSL